MRRATGRSSTCRTCGAPLGASTRSWDERGKKRGPKHDRLREGLQRCPNRGCWSKARRSQSKTQRERLAAHDRAQPVAPGAILQRAALAPQSLRRADILRLQQTLGNRAVAQMLSQPADNRTGLPDQLKAGIETLSGLSLDNVRVHRNSPRPAALDALAYAQGTDIHVGPGQERLLPHEAWHVVQQVQGRVRPTFQLNGEEINDDHGLEHEADVMGAKSMRMGPHDDTAIRPFEQRDSNGEEFQLAANPVRCQDRARFMPSRRSSGP